MAGNRRPRTATIDAYLNFGTVADILLASLGPGGAIENIGAAHGWLESTVTRLLGSGNSRSRLRALL
jgi:hypothetical protein